MFSKAMQLLVAECIEAPSGGQNPCESCLSCDDLFKVTSFPWGVSDCPPPSPRAVGDSDADAAKVRKEITEAERLLGQTHPSASSRTEALAPPSVQIAGDVV